MKQEKKSGSRTLIWILIIIVMFLAYLAHRYNRDASKQLEKARHNAKIRSMQLEKARNEVKIKIQSIHDETIERNKKIYLKTISDSDVILNGGFDRAFRNIDTAVDELASYEGCVKLFYYTIVDGVKNTNKVDYRIEEILNKYITNEIATGLQEAETSLNGLQESLANNRIKMVNTITSNAETMLIAQEFGEVQSSFTNFRKELNYIGETFPSISSATIASTLGLTINALLMKRTITQIQTTFAKAVARFGATNATALAAAAADGPLPIGDIIALVVEIGGIAWTAYEIYDAQVVLKDNVMSELRTAIGDYKEKTTSTRDKIANDLFEIYNKQNTEDVGNLLKLL